MDGIIQLIGIFVGTKSAMMKKITLSVILLFTLLLQIHAQKPTFESGIDYMSKRMYQPAVDVFTQIIQQEKDKSIKSMAYKYRGLSRVSMRQFEEAVEDFKHAEKLDPSDVNTILERGKTYILIDKTEDAIQAFKQVVKKDKDGQDGFLALEYLGEIALGEGEYVDAVNYFEQMLFIQPNYAKGFYLLGMAIVKFIELEDDKKYKIKFKYTLVDACENFKKASQFGYSYAVEWRNEYCK